MATAMEEETLVGNFESEDLCEVICQPCHEDGNIREAAGMCLDCQDYLCRQCFDVHKTPKPMRTHKLINKEHMLKSQISMARKDKCTEKCHRHDEGVIKYYCRTHHELGCNDCITMDHRTCDEITYIPDAAKDLCNNEEYKQAEMQLKSSLTKLNNLLENANQTAEKFYCNCSEAVTSVRTLRTEINDSLDKIETVLIEKVETEKSEMITRVTKFTEKLNTSLTELKQMITMTNSLHNKGHKCDLYILYMKSKSKLQSMDDLFKETEIGKSIKATEIRFVPNKHILNILEENETFGKLIEAETGSNEPESKPRTEHRQGIDVQIDSDTKTCCITGSVVLPDESLLLVDFNNYCIKYVSRESSKVTKHVKLSCKPWDVTMITNTQAAVTLTAQRQIALIDTRNAFMTAERTINVKDRCYGVDYKEGRLAVSFSPPHKIQLFNLQGTLLCTIENDKQGQSLFAGPLHVALGHHNSTLYVSNWDSHSVVCVKMDGSVMATYTNNMLVHPGGLLVDRSGNVYVCGKGSYNIHQISPDCRKIQVLMTKTDGLNSPRSISYSDTNNTFIVGMRDDKVKLYTSILDPL